MLSFPLPTLLHLRPTADRHLLSVTHTIASYPQLPRELSFPRAKGIHPTHSRSHCQCTRALPVGFFLAPADLQHIFTVVLNLTSSALAACLCKVHHECFSKDQGRPPCLPSAAQVFRSLSTEPTADCQRRKAHTRGNTAAVDDPVSGAQECIITERHTQTPRATSAIVAAASTCLPEPSVF